MKVNKYETPKHLKEFGIDICPDCGKYKSLDNTTCYGCGFQPEDVLLHERALNRKHLGFVKNSEQRTIYLAQLKFKGDRNNPNTLKYHLVKNEITYCGDPLHKRNPYQIIGVADKVVIRKFNSNPCTKCKKVYNNDEFKTVEL